MKTHSNSFRFFVAVLVVLFTGLFAGCGGGGGGSDSSSTSSPSTPAAGSYTITGNIGVAKAGISVHLTGQTTGSTVQALSLQSTDVDKTTTTDSTGAYTFTGLSNGTYTITPTSDDYTFTPASTSTAISGSSVTDTSSFVLKRVAGVYDDTVSSGSVGALDHDSLGNIWVGTTDAGVNSITKISSIGTVLVAPMVIGTSPDPISSIVVDRTSGNVWVADRKNVYELSSDGTLIHAFTTLSLPTNLTVDKSGKAWVSNYVSGTVRSLTADDPYTVGPAYFVGNAHATAEPSCMTVDASNNIWVCNYHEGTISKVTQAGVVTTYSSNCNFPDGIAIDGTGNLWVLSYDDGKAVKISPAGALVDTYLVANADHIAFDSTGNAWITCKDTGTNTNTIVKMSAAGAVLGTETLSGHDNLCIFDITIDADDNVWVANPNVEATVTELIY
jgi:streptogramin lyase